MDRFILGHQTSSARLQVLVRDGIRPHIEHGDPVRDDLQSDPDCVYLLTRPDRLYFKRACEEFGGQGILVLVEVAKNRLEPDEAVFSAAKLRAGPADRQLFQSMAFGQCKHPEGIAPSAFRGIYAEDGRPASFGGQFPNKQY